MKTRAIAAGDFKNRCLKLMDEVQRDGIPLVVTKRGKPVVRVVPAGEPAKPRGLRNTVVFEAEDIFSTGETWDADR